MLHRFTTSVIATAVMLGTSVAAADFGRADESGKPNMLGKAHPFSVDELPPGRMRTKIESLPRHARQRAMQWLHQFDFPENDVENMVIDEEGAVLYVDPSPTELPMVEQGAGVDDGHFGTESGAATEDAFLLHSRPGAANTVFLDFDGHTFANTAWSADAIEAKAFDLDGDPWTFSPAEHSAIAEIWHRMAEDFSGFDIDVTTEEPDDFGPTTGRVLITSKTAQDGNSMPHGNAGGVAYVGVWGRYNYASYYSPALVYYDNLAKSTTYMAEASAHEFGHNLGLSHDGASGVSYYSGHGSGSTSWAPIMGNSYSRNVTQWSKGEYAGANNTQDDIAIITSKLSLAQDDHSNGFNNATPLLVESDGQILVSNPETDSSNTFTGNKGIIESDSDQDYFYFDADAGQVDLTINPAWDAFYRDSRRGANLDTKAILMDADGRIITESDPTSDTYAEISANVSPGRYYLAVTGVGNSNYSGYASTGQYFISGSVTPGEQPDLMPVADFGYSCVDLSCSFTDASSDSDSTITAWSWSFGDNSSASISNPSHTYSGSGNYQVSLSVIDSQGLSDSVNKTVLVNEPNAPPTADFSYSCSNLSCDFTDRSDDKDGSIASRSWKFGDGVSASSQDPVHTYGASGTYNVTLTVIDNDGANANSTRSVTVSAPIDNIAPTVTITSPGGGDVSGRITLSANAYDAGGVVQIQIFTDNVLRCSGITSTSCTWNLRKVSTGSHIIRAEAVDTAGNKGIDTVTVNVTDGGSKGGKGKSKK